MLITKEKEILLSGNKIKYYEDKGYIIPRTRNKWGKLTVAKGTTLLINVYDLPDGSGETVDILCDYCLEKGIEKIIKKEWRNYLKENVNGIIHKDACYECASIKTKESNLKVYNSVPQKLDFVKEKISRKNRIDFNIIQREFKEKNCTLITTEDEYKNQLSILKYICKEHNSIIQETYWATFKQSKYGCPLCSHNRGIYNKYDIEYAKTVFNDCNAILLDSEYKDVKTHMKFICRKHPNTVQTTTLDNLIQKGNGCKFCRYEKISGENNNNWQGGISIVADYLRSQITHWKIDSMKIHNYKCVLTGIESNGSNLDVHHLYGFDMIIQELFYITNIKQKQFIKDYTKEELNILCKNCLDLHYKYGYGIVIHKLLHKIFHQSYKFGNNTPEQFKEFKQKYYNFEFDDLLEEKYKYKNIIKNIS